MAVWAIVLAGGAGTRFWPASTATHPKQFLHLVDPHESLLATTIRRVAPLVHPARVTVSTGAALVKPARKIAGKRARIFAEPTARNTAPCIAWVTAAILAEDPDALCMVLPSDQTIARPAVFLACVRKALQAARKGFLVTIGLKPTRAETGFGYIERGSKVEGGVFRAKRFVEKPDAARARRYVASKRFLWNGGMFFYQARTMMAAVEKHAPDIAKHVAAIQAGKPLAREFAAMPSISIDHAVMEKAERVAVVPGDFGWSDLGSWEAAWEHSDKDKAGNVLPADAVAIDARDNLVWDRTARKRTYAFVGVSDLIVVETEDAVLIAPRARAQDVKLVVPQLRSRKR